MVQIVYPEWSKEIIAEKLEHIINKVNTNTKINRDTLIDVYADELYSWACDKLQPVVATLTTNSTSNDNIKEGKTYLVSAVSPQMVKAEIRRQGFDFKITPIDKPDNLKELYSAIGHKATADYLGVKFNRESLILERGDTLILWQINNGRLEEGVIELPEGATAEWLKVRVV